MIHKNKVCSWHRCDIGFKYHHTGEEWDTHQQFSKTDLPKTYEQKFIQENNPPQQIGALPRGYSVNPCNPGKHDNKWRMIALGTTIAVWGMIILTVWRVL